MAKIAYKKSLIDTKSKYNYIGLTEKKRIVLMYRYIKLIFVKKNIDFDRNIKKIILYLLDS
jgi:hypothetical protein